MPQLVSQRKGNKMNFKDRYLTENLSGNQKNLMIGSLGGLLAGKVANGALAEQPHENEAYAGLAGAATGIGAAALHNMLNKNKRNKGQ